MESWEDSRKDATAGVAPSFVRNSQRDWAAFRNCSSVCCSFTVFIFVPYGTRVRQHGCAPLSRPSRRSGCIPAEPYPPRRKKWSLARADGNLVLLPRRLFSRGGCGGRGLFFHLGLQFAE